MVQLVDRRLAREFLMRMVGAVLLFLLAAGCSAPAPSGPSAAIEGMRNDFEAQVLAIEKDYPGDADGLRKAAIDVEFHAFPSPQGHDAVLVDSARFEPAIADFLVKVGEGLGDRG